VDDPVITWALIGVGVIFIYGAYRKRNPLNLVSDVIGGQKAPESTSSAQSFLGGSALMAGSVATAIARAKSHLGDPYVFGANGPKAWDCSSLVQDAMAAAGVTIPRTSQEQARGGQPQAYTDIRPGDLIFTKGEDQSGAWVDYGHVAMAVGGGLEIQAPHTGDVVKIVQIPGQAQVQAIRRYIQ
jgi:cell wall-associated NlpC family hydrolase